MLPSETPNITLPYLQGIMAYNSLAQFTWTTILGSLKTPLKFDSECSCNLNWFDTTA